MDLHFDMSLAEAYHSGTQRARVLTEGWVAANLYCPRCGCPRLEHFSNNRPVADFFCPICGSQYELKSRNGRLGRKAADGAYGTMIERITSRQNPDFLFMGYSKAEEAVQDLIMIPKHFFVPAIIERRAPLGPDARRAGWEGCSILLDRIPSQGRIVIILDGVPENKNAVLERTARSGQLEIGDVTARGWLMEVLYCVERIPSAQFTLADMYRFDSELQARHPGNAHVRPKIRQSLQILRDRGFIVFLGGGHYKKV